MKRVVEVVGFALFAVAVAAFGVWLNLVAIRWAVR